MTIEELQSEVVDDFSCLDDWMDRYQQLIDLGGDLVPLAEAEKTPGNLIAGCQSRVWIAATAEADGTLTFRADSDALIVKGIIALLLRVLSGHRPADIAAADLHFIADIGLQEHLSPTRANGLLAMVQRIKQEALKRIRN